MTIIGLGATEQVGKDTIGRWLVERYGFTRLAFADAIREVLERINPRVGAMFTLSELLASGHTWDNLKQLPEVRRMLIDTGNGMRELVDVDVWLRPVIKAAAATLVDGGQVVVTDVRHWNELDALRGLAPDALMVNVVRPGSPERSAAERLCGDWFDAQVVNDGTVEELWAKVDGLIERLGVN